LLTAQVMLMNFTMLSEKEMKKIKETFKRPFKSCMREMRGCLYMHGCAKFIPPDIKSMSSLDYRFTLSERGSLSSNYVAYSM
jgi:hypothetical protein